MAQTCQNVAGRRKSSPATYPPNTNNNTSTTSLLYSTLPTLLQDRVPRIPSLRKFATGLSGKTTPILSPLTPETEVIDLDEETLSHRRNISTASSTGTATPPPSYASEFGSRPASAQGMDGGLPQANEAERASRVRWENVNHGSWLLAHTLRSCCSSISSSTGAPTAAASPELTRRLYVSSMEYFLSGLPEDLTPEEVVRLRLRLPAALLPEAYDASKTQIVVAGRAGSGREDQTMVMDAGEPSVLHRVTANVTLYMFLAAAFVLPYVKLFVAWAYQYDRQHKVSDRLVARGLVAADSVSRRAFALADGVGAMNDGKVGDAAKLLVLWWVQGLSGGVCEGVGGGMAACGMKVNSKTKRIEMDDGVEIEQDT